MYHGRKLGEKCTLEKEKEIMKARILTKLKEIEQQHKVEILFAVESGSRAWGFASPDSDYDVRFVYKRSSQDYLSLWDAKDTIEFMTEDDLDGSGWDLKKATLLLAKSNASFLGWLFSPLVYLDRGNTLTEMRQLAENNFSPVSGFYHYHSMNKGFNEQLENDGIRLKSFFYAMRTALCANWIVEFGSIPPVNFRELYPLIDAESVALLDALIEKKALLKESGRAEIDPNLVELAKRIVSDNNDRKDTCGTRKANRSEFDRFFINEVR